MISILNETTGRASMKNFLLFNDFSPEAEHAAELALLLAGKTNSNLYVWNTIAYDAAPAKRLMMVGVSENLSEIHADKDTWIERLESRLNWETGLRPSVHFIEGVDFMTDNVLSVVKKFDVGMLIRGIAEGHEQKGYIEASILKSATKSGCPVLLIPEDYPYRMFEKMVYATDLRFCRYEVVSFLTQLAKILDAGLLIANISEKGLPHMAETYAQTVFEEAVVNQGNKDHIYFSNIKERNVSKALDIIVNEMNNDLLVLVNNKFHFNELLGHDTPYAVPGNIRVPLLVFPS
jgi:hypothetical protein